MQLTLERELDLHVGENEPQYVEQPNAGDHGVGATTQVEKFRARWAEGVHVAIPPGVRCHDMHD